MIPIVIVGTGFSGLGLAIRLKQEGRDDFVVLERASEVGGTWRDNVYPGCACDIQSHLYSFSFAPSLTWSRAYSPQPEILRYLIDCADRFDVRRHVRFHCEVRSLRWADGHWLLETSQGEIRAQAVVLGTGPLSEPSIPKIPGLAAFQGPVFHSAEWPADFDSRGKRVVVVGTGASAVQFIPILQKQVSRLILFQRTPAWVVPQPNRAYSAFELRLFRRAPIFARALRTGIFWLREAFSGAFRHPAVMRALESIIRLRLKREVPDPVLRAKLTPSYTIGCKRILLSDTYWPALSQPNVDVETSALSEARHDGVVTSDGRFHAADAIVFATGFRVTDSPFNERIVGRGGQSLAHVWEGSPRAYLGIATNGFPNLFFMLGPNTGLGHTSVVLMIEAQIEHVLKVLAQLRTVRALEPRLEIEQAYIAAIDKSLQTTVWNSGGCQSWYLDRTGRNSTIWPKSVVSYRNLLKAEGTRAYEESPS